MIDSTIGLEEIVKEIVSIIRRVDVKLNSIDSSLRNKNFLAIQQNNFNECVLRFLPDFKQIRKTYEDDLDEVMYSQSLKRIITYGLDVMDDIDCKIDLHLNE